MSLYDGTAKVKYLNNILANHIIITNDTYVYIIIIIIVKLLL